MAAACGGTEPSNAPPVAAFTARCAQLACVFDDTSTDSDGTLAAHAWSFGDGATSTASSPAHSYASPGGDFEVTVVVTDNDGASATVSQRVTVSSENPAPANHPPTPDFYASCEGLTCVFGDWSADPDAGDAVASRTWNFGDTGASAETNAMHTYGAPGGPFTVTLTVTDRHGASATATQQVDIQEPGTENIPPPVPGQIAFSRDGRIYRANTDGSGLVQLSAGPADSEPAWSPDGTRIAFARGGEGGGIYVMTADGANPVRRVASGGSPTWSPDGQWVGFSCRVGSDGGICKVRADDDGAAPVAVLARTGYLAYPAWAPDGTRIAFSSDWNMFDFWLDLWAVSLDGSPPTMLLGSPNSTRGFDRVQPAWSPDGRRIALVTCPYGFTVCATGALALVNADGSGLLPIATTTGLAHPTWSPDGQVIAFAAGTSIEWITTDGSRRGRIIANGTTPTWRPAH